ncbi:pilus assembly protein CpaE [Pacificimonas flava]|uniref:Pilus assembly protein CpaE n=2 Tax=Pacificimonas TaxID=1960290 RepID=A0A219B2S0_9SPHN|nr:MULTISPECIES: pilus assembly protein CpaE [Pacificimonas]MBZ6377919.1 pilus assembly protein CpaE [Pacificimonas aurantium]OWV32423.1 pilus assembly protein CpaE [Pacificimonas flava]
MNAISPLSAGARDVFAAFVGDDELASTMRAVLPDLGWPDDHVNLGGLQNAVQTLSVTASPAVLFVDLSDAADPITEINALAEVCEPGTIVLAAGTVNDVGLYRDLVASGIQDYLTKPVQPEVLREALLQAQIMLQAPRGAEEETADRPALGVTVIGARGGVGASTLATSLAFMLGDRAGSSTALLDLDVQFGTGALSFDLEPGRGLTDALENPSRIDGLFIERAMTRVNDKLAVLSAEAPINQPMLADGTALHQLEEEMLAAFDALVVDMPRSMAVQHPHLLAQSGYVVLVTDLSLAATRDTIRLLGFLRQHAPQAKVVVAANKVQQSPPPEVSKGDFEASIERKVDIMLPFDVKQCTAAAKQGKALAAIATGKLKTAMEQLRTSVSPQEEDEGEKESVLGKMRALLPSKGTAKAAGAR